MEIYRPNRHRRSLLLAVSAGFILAQLCMNIAGAPMALKLQEPPANSTIMANEFPCGELPSMPGPPSVFTLVEWREVAAAKERLPRYVTPIDIHNASQFPFPVKVISMRRAKERRESMATQLEAQHVQFEFVDAVDGDSEDAFPDADIQRYFSGERLAHFLNATGNARRKVACDLSHFRLMHALLASTFPAFVVLEDDVQLPAVALSDMASPFLDAIKAKLEVLPEDWDVMYLALSFITPGGGVGPGVRSFRHGTGAYGMVYTRRGALIALREAELGALNVDSMLQKLQEVSSRQPCASPPPRGMAARLYHRGTAACLDHPIVTGARNLDSPDCAMLA